ncbi:LacI family transcriptional regulator [Xanthobacter flavus]|uniref:Transcriptional regulator n=1 Tax=Xanthobacter flavus TaxID=281 RepID=A0A9W6CGM2_XANFL|nr:LacI family DNA-binding transcriptional regulator [Xanthobacter flavus]MDR6332204.1 LacI family transcriptional regulator [Xanthobacter flavus]GLI22048.1 transcriptional regulator [Xanthobacter flavus]
MEGAKGPQGRRLPAARDAAEPADLPDEAPLASGLRVRLKDVAAHAGVSRATVSLVLRKSPLVKAETRAKVEEAMAGLGYVYNRSAANLRSGASRTVGLVLCEITTPNFAQLTAGIDEVLGTEGYMAFIGNAAEDAARQREVLVRMQEHGVDGLVVVASENTRADALEEGACARMPCVLAQRRVEGFPADYVGPDYGAGMELITEHLIGLGHRNIAFIGGVRRIAPLAERMAGFHRALRRHKLKSGAVVPCAVIDRSSGYTAARELLAKGDIPSAIVCYNDVVAFGVMLALDERGLVPGRDVAVVGCDDVDEAGLHRPALTTFTTDPRVVGREAARLLLRRIAHPDRPREEIIVPPRLVIRQSCGAANRPTGGAR